MNIKTVRSPITYCTIQKTNRKMLIPHKLKLNKELLTKEIITLCPEFEMMEKLKGCKTKKDFGDSTKSKERKRIFKKVMIKSSSDVMVLNMIMNNKKFANYCNKHYSSSPIKQNELKKLKNSHSSNFLMHKLATPSRNKDQTFLTNLKSIKKYTFNEESLGPVSTNRIKIKEPISLQFDKFTRSRNKFNSIHSQISCNRSQSSRSPLTTSRMKRRVQSSTLDRIEKVSQPMLVKLDDLRSNIRKDVMKQRNFETFREQRQHIIMREMKEIESCIDYDNNIGW